MIDNRLSKVDILIQQKKYSEAERILKDLLTEDSTNIQFLALLADVCLQQGKTDAALSIIDNAIGLSPDTPALFYIKSTICIEKENLVEAEKNLARAIQLDPHDAAYFALLAHIKLYRKKYEEALQLADQSLAIDPENLVGLNTRSNALLKLNKSAESFATIEGALREDPNNAYTHANYGWGLLEKGQHKKALEHFREALKNDPGFEYAQAGMLEALKASNPVYRLFLKYAFWMGNFSSKYQWGVIIGFYIGMKALRLLASNNETLQPYLTPMIIALALIAFSTWVITPISNLFLRFNVYGKYLLSKKEIRSSNFVAISLAVFLLGLTAYLFAGTDEYLAIAVFGFSMMLPLSSIFLPSKYKTALVSYVAVLGLIGIAAIVVCFSTGELFNAMSTLFILGFVAYQWIANLLIIKE